MSPSHVLAMLLALAPHAPRLHADDVAGAIAVVAHDRHDAAVLLAIEHQETSFRSGLIEFGLTCCRARLEGQPLDRWAATSLSVWLAGRRAGGSDHKAYFYYFTGRLPQSVRGRTRAFRRFGQRGVAYAERCEHDVARLLRMR